MHNDPSKRPAEGSALREALETGRNLTWANARGCPACHGILIIPGAQ